MRIQMQEQEEHCGCAFLVENEFIYLLTMWNVCLYKRMKATREREKEREKTRIRNGRLDVVEEHVNRVSSCIVNFFTYAHISDIRTIVTFG